MNELNKSRGAAHPDIEPIPCRMRSEDVVGPRGIRNSPLEAYDHSGWRELVKVTLGLYSMVPL